MDSYSTTRTTKSNDPFPNPQPLNPKPLNPYKPLNPKTHAPQARARGAPAHRGRSHKQAGLREGRVFRDFRVQGFFGFLSWKGAMYKGFKKSNLRV